ncbi:unnamed protein product, partial [marine sediment metagenome]
VPEMDVKRFGKELLSTGIYSDTHSWAGSRGLVATLIFENGEYEECLRGGWHSENGRVTHDDPAIPLWRNFLTSDGEMDHFKVEVLAAVVVNEWDNYNNPTNEYDDWEIYVRPRQQHISIKLQHSIDREVIRLRNLVG